MNLNLIQSESDEINVHLGITEERATHLLQVVRDTFEIQLNGCTMKEVARLATKLT